MGNLFFPIILQFLILSVLFSKKSTTDGKVMCVLEHMNAHIIIQRNIQTDRPKGPRDVHD